MIQEYYLHMFSGVDGGHDARTATGRLTIAALMAGFGLNASTKSDLQGRVGWQVTPGCFLGQKEIPQNDYNIRNNAELKFAMALVPFRKVNRTMNYQLDWSVLDGDWGFFVNAPTWINLAKIYWLGYFLFGRNVFPDSVLAKLHQRFDPQTAPCPDSGRQLRNPFVMQFMKNIGLPVQSITPHSHCFSESMEDLSRTQIFASLAIALNHAENVPGFYTAAALVPSLVPEGTKMREFQPAFSLYYNSVPGKFPQNSFPLSSSYYYQFSMGNPSIPTSLNRVPTQGRDILAVLFCKNDRTPMEEAETGYQQVMGTRLNLEYLEGNVQAWLTGAMIWEYYLMIMGTPLFPIERLIEIRERKQWQPDYLLDNLVFLNPANGKNCTVGQLIRFHLERQSQV